MKVGAWSGGRVTPIVCEMMQVVWFKRDLRTQDHEPLVRAAACGEVLPIYIVEPSVLGAADSGGRHWEWNRRSLIELRRSLGELGLPLVVRVGEVVELLRRLHGRHGIGAIWSHEETGNGVTFARDVAVGRWCREAGVRWTEVAQFGVVRRLGSRTGWAGRWERFMASEVVAAPVGARGFEGIDPGAIPTGEELGLPRDDCRIEQTPGECAGLNTLSSFLNVRGEDYGRRISSPLSAATGGSRMSAYLAWGNVSMRTVLQATRSRVAGLGGEGAERQWRRSLRSFESRLHWHCHFIQKLESDPRIENENFVRAFDTLRPAELDRVRFDAWRTGRTGYPMIDAVMRCLQGTGWINFRMRSMVVSFSGYHLWQHWKEPALHLARMFIDYEPGIHYSQMQMQSGTTGINTLRIYSPTKQAIDQDPKGVFIRRWVPELAGVPDGFIHEPVRMPMGVQREAGCVIGRDYPVPIVDHLEAVRAAKERFTVFRGLDATREQARAVNEKHGSRKSGLRQVGVRRVRKRADDSPQLFE